MPRDDITLILRNMRDGRSEAIGDLLPLVYAELRAIARRNLASGGRDATLDTSALVHDAYLKLFDRSQLDWQDRRHFFSVAAIAMRQIIVDRARKRSTQKRGGGLARVDLDAANLAVDERAEDILALNEALARLAEVDVRLGRIVELRFFGGLTHEEVGDVVGLAPRTVKLEWAKARTWLYRELFRD